MKQNLLKPVRATGGSSYHAGKVHAFTKPLLIIFMMVFFTHVSQAQHVVSGTVISGAEQVGMPGVSVLIKGTSTGVTTDGDGSYSVSVPNENSVLIFSFIGYKSQEVSVSGRSTIDISLEDDISQLDEIVVVGYGTQKKSEVTSAVASVKAEEFTAGAMRDASELIKGKVAGLDITNGSGDPSASANIFLRGVSTLQGSTSPLILIDGVPGSFNTVSPADIASIDVLKDASAAAIYGTRGANGVILITTKGGRRYTPATITYSHYSAISKQFNQPEFLTASEYLEYAKDFDFENKFIEEAENNGGVSDTDWLDEISRTGYIQNHNLMIQGGTETTTYSASVNYMNQEGVFKGSDNEELRVNLNLDQYFFDDKLKIGFNFLRGTQKIGSLGDGKSFNALIYRNALIRNPLLNIKDDNDNWIETSRLQYINPVGMLEETEGELTNNWTRFTSNISLYLLDNWETNLMLATDRSNNFRGYYETSKHYYSVSKSNRAGFGSRADDQLRTDYLELTSKYSKSFGAHNISLMAGYSYQYNVNEGGWANNYDFPTDAYSYHNLEAGRALLRGEAGMDSYKNDNTLVGFFGRLKYGFDNRFDILASVRREASSKFGDNYKWGTFPSVSAGWTISNEAFMDNLSLVSFLKLRAGYGVTGVIPTQSYLSKPLLSYYGDYFYYNGAWINALEAVRNPNADLKWERSGEINIGVDFGLLEGRISGSIDFYNKKTKDLLWEYAVPQPPNVYPSTLANVGEMQNKGIEILLEASPVRSNNFQWNTTLTFSHNKNELLSLSNDLYEQEGDFIDEYGVGDPISTVSHRLEPGQPIGNFWGLKSVDINEDGLWVIELPNGETEVMQSNAFSINDNKQYLGNGIPKYRAGWTNTFKYKNFDLSVVLNGAFGFQLMNQQRMFYENPNINYNVLKSAMDDVYGKRRLGYKSQTFVSYYIEDADYVKLENATLGYSVDMSNVKFVNSLRFYVSGSNLAIITNYKGSDPEVPRNDLRTQGIDNRDKFPSVRTYTLGVNVNF
ncbi:SusC/RagA family TonB-linked outer membrane protein [Fulvivirga sediminis]|uniref:TonB-dependent receptor n=1 Tax=Fulvivirga sediminis TaxID=2803949 RepID=A0A937F7F3_9BACT|nr:TonB-dependent receptor [Fulvivirga sediminis]MBL3657125.1 TonB-dependent receptor [Fulvivirga sediminis]